MSKQYGTGRQVVWWRPLVGLISALVSGAVAATTVTYTTVGATTWVAPPGVTSVTVEAWAGGGSGGGASGNPARGGGGAGGQYASGTVTVVPGNSYTVTVGDGGAGSTGAGQSGGDSSFAASVVAKGGAGGAAATNNNTFGSGGAGSTAGGVGTVVRAGGNGSSQSVTVGGAGGGGAGSTAAGGNASGNTAGSGGSVGGGAGAAGPTSGGSCGNVASVAGGGGCGGYATSNTNRSGGDGARGQVILSYTQPPSASTIAASALTSAGATLNGSVISGDAAATVSFQYGTTLAYGSTVTASPSPLAASTSATAVSAAVTGLVCGTQYNFRVVAVSAVGTSNGPNLTFTPTCPSVASISRASTNPNTPNANVSWTVTFSTSVTGVDATDFSLVQTAGATGASITSVTGSGTSWTVVANTGTANGTLGLNLVDNNSITDALGTRLGGAALGDGNFTGQTYTLQNPYPVLAKVASTASAVVNDVLTFNITASNPYGVNLAAFNVSDVLPTGMTYIANASTAGTVSAVGQTVTWSVPGLVAGASEQLTLVVRVTQQGTLTNTVTSPGAPSASDSVLVLATAVVHYHLDETAGSWTGAANEVIDSGASSIHGRRLATTTPTTTNTINPTPTIASQYSSVMGGFCNAASFDGNAVVQVASSPTFNYTTQVSASAWIYPTAYPSGGSDYYTILSNDQNYEFHLSPTGKLYWWWGGGARQLTSAATIPLNQWTHIAITMDAVAGRERIYINGQPDTNTNNWTGTLTSNPCNFYLGGDVTTGSCALLPARNFRGRIDEIKLYGFELSQAEVQADMNLGRNCAGAFDHVRIEHDASGSVCTPETVTVKACLNAACTTLYAGNVTVNMSSSAGTWVGGNSLALSNGVGVISLSNSTAGNVTLGVSSTSVLTAGPARCFSGGTETCTMNFAAASCSFDAVEVAGAPRSRIFTKLAGTSFNVDVLAVTSGGAVNTAYTGSVNVDLVDTTSSACPTGAGLTSAVSVDLAGGRKTTALTYNNAAANARVRVSTGSGSPACSTDNFAIRPQQFSVTAPVMSNTGLTGTPAAAAGTAFVLDATTAVSSGYVGTAPVLNSANVNDHNSLPIAAGTLSGTFAAGTGSKASGAAFRYLDVGNLQFAQDAVVDSSFTAVDQAPGDCVANSTSNTLAAGKYGCNIGNAPSARLGRWYPSHYSFTGTLTPSCTAGGFTYMDHDALGVALTLKAHAPGAGAASASDPVVSRYTSTYTNRANVTLSGDNSGAAVAVTRLGSPALPTMPDKTLWASGEWRIADTYAFARLPAGPDGPYDSFALKVALADPDNATPTLVGAAITNTTSIRFGRLQLQNMFGSELLPLQLPIEAQYWNGTAFVRHVGDSCTAPTLPAVVTLGAGATPNGAANQYFYPVATGGNQLASGNTTATLSTTSLVNGRDQMVYSRPGAGRSGWIDIILDVPNHLLGNWGNCMGQTGTAGLWDDRPCARATFGIYKSPLIYRRENY